MKSLIRLTLGIIGLLTLAVSAAMLGAPAWFFRAVAPFAPYNHHFIGDIGAFSAPLGAALLIAARDPRAHRTLIGLAAVGNLLHAFSHLRDWELHLPPAMPLAAGLLTEAGTLISGLLLLAISWQLCHERSGSAPSAAPTPTGGTR